MPTLLATGEVAALRAAAFTYAEVGATSDTTPPVGYRFLARSRPVRGRGFEGARDLLMSWQLHERAGLGVAVSTPYVEPGAVVVQRLGVGPASLRIPCRVVRVIDEPDRVG